ncbi:13323_t:CDS:2 [Ambispora gerdemannii]|uniref:13323_t:CDS:1 n=1 Tax=Ambispora gerdemannii TaxID=144530 RepID=A0A9N9BV28_9GLOM|nr:13323_t:CDS:2 [Ambispora gerdemannii]
MLSSSHEPGPGSDFNPFIPRNQELRPVQETSSWTGFMSKNILCGMEAIEVLSSD